MAPSSLLDTIELFDHIGAHYALPRLDCAAPAPVLASAICHLFALVETAFNDAARALDVDLTRLERVRTRTEAEIVYSTATEKSPRRVYVPEYVDSSPLSSPLPATPTKSPLASKMAAPFSLGKTVEPFAAQPYTWPPSPPRSSSSASVFGLSSVDWDDCDTDYESDNDNSGTSNAPRPAIVPDRTFSVLHAPHMVPQPSGTSSRPPPPPPPSPPRLFNDWKPRRVSAPSSAPSVGASWTDSSSIPRKRPRPLAQRRSAPSASTLPGSSTTEPRRAVRASKTNAQASWSWLVSKRRKTESGAPQVDDG